MAWSGTGAGAESVFRHPLKAMTRLSQRTPLRIKLIAALLALVALALTVISFTSIVVFRGYLLNQADNQVQRLVGQSTNSPPPSPHQSDSYTFLGFVYEVIDSQGSLVSYFGTGEMLGSSGPDVPTSSSWLSAHAGHPVTVPALSGGGQWRIIEQPVTYPSQDGTTQFTGTLVIGQNLGNISRTLGYLTGLDVIVSLVIMLGLGVVSVAVVRTNLRSLDDIEETAEDIAAGHLDRRVPELDPRTEVGRLGRSINSMLAQIESAFHDREESEEAAVQSEERMRRFIADASHELRTPYRHSRFRRVLPAARRRGYRRGWPRRGRQPEPGGPGPDHATGRERSVPDGRARGGPAAARPGPTSSGPLSTSRWTCWSSRRTRYRTPG